MEERGMAKNLWDALQVSRRTLVGIGSAAVAHHLWGQSGAAEDATEDAGPLLLQAATAMAAVQSFHFEMTIPEGRSLVIDEIELAGFSGDVQRPDRFRAEFTAKAAIISLTIKIISIGGQIWVTDPMAREESWVQVSTGETDEIPLPDILNPDRLLLAAVNVIQEPRLVGEEEIDGQKTTRIDGTFDPQEVNEQVFEVTGTPVPELSSITSDQPIPVSIWLDEAARLRRVEFDGPLTAADEGDVLRRFDVTNIDEPIDIQPPT